MEQNLKDIKLILIGLKYTRDIEDVVFDNNGQKYSDPNKCLGKKVINGYNASALTWNEEQIRQFGRKTGLEKEIFTLDDTRHFCIGWIKPRDNISSGYNVMTFYFKEFIIMETTQNCLNPNPPKYDGFRHYFTPDILLFLKHFNKTQLTLTAMNYVRQNPHYFKHHTMDMIALIDRANDTLEKIIDQNKINNQKLELLEQENQNLKTKIVEMEENAKRSDSPIKLKIE